MKSTFSICIPNYNYEQYLSTTIESVLNQTNPASEIVIADNASTDQSLSIIEACAQQHKNLKYKQHATNIGFAGNLDAVGSMATSDWMIMLSSDDVMMPNALEVYEQFTDLIPKSESFSFCSAFIKIDSLGNTIEPLGAKQTSLWQRQDIDPKLSNQLGFDVYKVSAPEMLRRCLSSFYNPFNFASTCFQQSTYIKVGGYGGGRLYNPDKWFHWKLLAQCDFVYYIDSPLFQYRWHAQNQQNQQQQTGVLKYWLDEYRNCFETDERMLQKAKMSRIQLETCFTNHLLKEAARQLLNGNKQMGKRLMNAAKAFYPAIASKSAYWYQLQLLRIAYPLRRVIRQWVRS